MQVLEDLEYGYGVPVDLPSDDTVERLEAGRGISTVRDAGRAGHPPVPYRALQKAVEVDRCQPATAARDGQCAGTDTAERP